MFSLGKLRKGDLGLSLYGGLMDMGLVITQSLCWKVLGKGLLKIKVSVVVDDLIYI
jgi:hypothetical protein